MFQIRFASNRAIDQRKNIELLCGLPTDPTGN